MLRTVSSLPSRSILRVVRQPKRLTLLNSAAPFTSSSINAMTIVHNKEYNVSIKIPDGLGEDQLWKFKPFNVQTQSLL